jgi:hypothetical protein
MKTVMGDLKLQHGGPMKLFCDDKSTINIANSFVQHGMTKYIKIDRHFVMEKLDYSLINTTYIPSRFITMLLVIGT